MINYHESSLTVMYIQAYLREYYGFTVKKTTKYKYDKIRKRRYLYTGYEITGNDPIRVTGYLTPQTYSAIALYMAANYPNEGFPYLWTEDSENLWIPNRIYNNLFLDEETGELTTLKYRKYDSKTGEYTEYPVEVPEHLKYYNDTTARSEGRKKIVEFNTRLSTDEEMSSLVDLISYNMENIINNPKSISIPDRVVSYILKEVVTPSSSDEEILRAKKMFYESVSPFNSPLKYDPALFDEVVTRQSKFRSKYVIDDDEKTAAYPDQYEYFYVTGYVDPWTEVIIKGGIEVGS